MAIKQSEDYEIANGEEVDTLGEKYHISFTGRDGYYTNSEFYSKDVTIKGKRFTKDSRAEISHQAIGKVPGLRCPDCNAQAYYTDYPQVAVCGDYPGWYFFFRRLDQDVKGKARLVIKNGELIEETEQDKKEGSF